MPPVTCPTCGNPILPSESATYVAAEKRVFHTTCRLAKVTPAKPPAGSAGAPDTRSTGTGDR